MEKLILKKEKTTGCGGLCSIPHFLFKIILFMTFFRVFTFMGYGRALRGSLLLGGLVYFFMPDFSPEKINDTIFIGIPLSIIILRTYMSRRMKKIDKVDAA